MLDLKNHPYFTEYTDKKTGVVSYILNKRVAQIQQHFYFTNTSLTYDGKYLWILCANEPAQIRTLAVVSLDPQDPFIRCFAGAGYSGAGNMPGIIPGTHDVIFAEGRCIYTVNVEGEIKEIFRLGDEIVKGRPVERMFTHASFSKDMKKLALDIHIYDKTYMGYLDWETKEFHFIDTFVPFHNHAQFSTIDPELMLIDQEGWNDFSGEHFIFKNRTWLLDINGTRFEPLIQSTWFGHDGSMYCHDFWSKDGLICFQDYERGAFECNVQTRELTCVWKRPVCHAHTNFDRSLWTADQKPYEWTTLGCDTLIFDRKTGKEIEIFSKMPFHGLDRDRIYHIDPHPAFTDDGEYIISTTTVLDGKVDVAITPVKTAVELCRKNGKHIDIE